MNKKKLSCNNCNQETWHKPLFEKIYQEDSLENYTHWAKSIVTECCGCEQPHYFWSSWTKDKNGSKTDDFKEWVFPPKRLHQPPSWYINFAFSTAFDESEETKQVSNLLREVHSALDENCPRLGIMGIRAIFEHIMISKVNDNGSFKKNLNQFQANGYISKIQNNRGQTMI